MIRLTAREAEVAELLGRTNAAIAARLCISTLTVSDHVQSILRKTQTNTRTSAALALHREADLRDRLDLLIDLIGMAS